MLTDCTQELLPNRLSLVLGDEIQVEEAFERQGSAAASDGNYYHLAALLVG